MANNSHVYSIDLDINMPQTSQKTLEVLEQTFEDSNHSVHALNRKVLELSKVTKDNVMLEKQYNKVIEKRLKGLDKEVDRLEAEKINLINNKNINDDLRKRALKLIDEKIRSAKIQKDVVKREAQELKIKQAIVKAEQTEVKLKKTLGKLVLDDLKALKDKVKTQLAFVSALKTTEGRYKAIKKVAGGAAKLAFKGAKLAGGAAGALVGGAIASSGSLAEKEKALGSLKSGIDPALVDEVYVKTGADFPSIIAALNNLSDTTVNSGKLVQGAVLELQNPGAGHMLLAGTHRTSKDIEILNNAIAQIKKQTGAQDMSAAIEAASKSNLVTSGRVSQIDYLHAYSALAQHGLDENTINRILRDTAQQEGNFIENLNKADLTRYVRGQDKTRMGHIELGLDKLDYDKAPEKTAAQSTVEKLRQFELKKDEILMNFMEPAVKVMEALEPLMDPLKTVIEKLVPVVKWLADLASNFVNTFIMPIIEGVKKALSWWGDEEDKKEPKVSGGGHAQGGLVTSPSIVGEAGPELVLPLDYSRAGRANQIINNFTTTQSFNLASNQSTPLALASAVGQNKFVQRSKVF